MGCSRQSSREATCHNFTDHPLKQATSFSPPRPCFRAQLPHWPGSTVPLYFLSSVCTHSGKGSITFRGSCATVESSDRQYNKAEELHVQMIKRVILNTHLKEKDTLSTLCSQSRQYAPDLKSSEFLSRRFALAVSKLFRGSTVLVNLLNNIGCLLGHGKHCCLNISSRLKRKHACINHSNIRSAIDFQARVNDSAILPR